MKWVLKNGRLVQRNTMWEEAIIGLGWLCGFVWNHIISPLGKFCHDWESAPDIRHSRAAAIALFFIIFLSMMCIL